MSFELCFTFILTLAFVTSEIFHKGNLVQLQIIFRHGVSAPERIFPNDSNPITIWRRGLKQLTTLGKKRSFMLGKIIRMKYGDFMKHSPDELDLQCCTTYPCAESSLAFAASLYPPSYEWQIFPNFPWQPIAITYASRYLDSVKLAKRPCPVAQKDYENILKSPKAQEFLSKYKDAFDYWTKYSGWEIKDWDIAAELFEVLETENQFKLEVPRYSKLYWDQLGELSDASYYWNYESKLQQRLRGGLLLYQVIKSWGTKVSNTSNPNRIVSAYSTHSSNIAAFLSAISAFNNKTPKFSTAIVIELYKQQNKLYTRFLYMNSTTPERDTFHKMHTLYPKGCNSEGFCDVKVLVNSVKDLIPRNWNQECQLV